MSGNEYSATPARRGVIKARDPSNAALIADRESGAIFEVCDRLRRPLVVLKTVSDRLDKYIQEVHTGDEMQEGNALKIHIDPGKVTKSARENTWKVCEALLEMKSNVLSPEDLLRRWVRCCAHGYVHMCVHFTMYKMW